MSSSSSGSEFPKKVDHEKIPIQVNNLFGDDAGESVDQVDGGQDDTDEGLVSFIQESGGSELSRHDSQNSQTNANPTVVNVSISNNYIIHNNFAVSQ